MALFRFATDPPARRAPPPSYGPCRRGALRFAFNDLALHRVEAACLPANEPSRRLLERVGFHREGMARAYLRINGVWADHLLYAALSSDRLPGGPG